MRSVIRAVAFCAALVIGALPAVTLACQWACETPDAMAMPGHHHGAEHVETTHPADEASEGPALRASGHGCDRFIEPGVTSGSVRVPSLSARVLADTGVPALTAPARVFLVSSVSPSPPGARSSPLPLRI